MHKPTKTGFFQVILTLVRADSLAYWAVALAGVSMVWGLMDVMAHILHAG